MVCIYTFYESVKPVECYDYSVCECVGEYTELCKLLVEYSLKVDADILSLLVQQIGLIFKMLTVIC